MPSLDLTNALQVYFGSVEALAIYHGANFLWGLQSEGGLIGFTEFASSPFADSAFGEIITMSASASANGHDYVSTPGDPYYGGAYLAITRGAYLSNVVMQFANSATHASQEAIIKFRPKTTSQNRGLQLGLRYTIDGSDNHSGYYCEYNGTNNSGICAISIHRKTGSGYANVHIANTNFSNTPVLNQWNWLRFKVDGNNLKAKLWQDDNPEPEAWTLESTDSNLVGLGKPIFGIDTTTSNGSLFDVDYMAAACGDDVELPIPLADVVTADGTWETIISLDGTIATALEAG